MVLAIAEKVEIIKKLQTCSSVAVAEWYGVGKISDIKKNRFRFQHEISDMVMTQKVMTIGDDTQQNKAVHL